VAERDAFAINSHQVGRLSWLKASRRKPEPRSGGEDRTEIAGVASRDKEQQLARLQR
jgi:hypothetical protein